MPRHTPPARAVLYAELDDEIALLYARVQAVRSTGVALVVPARARVLQSLVNLKILRHKVTQLGKDVTLVTTDTAGRELATKAGFPVAEKVITEGKTVSLVGLAPARDAIRQTLKPEGHKTIGRRVLEIGSSAADTVRSLATLDREKIPFARPGRGVRAVLQRLAGGVSEEEATAEAAEGGGRLIVHGPDRRILFTLAFAALSLLFFVGYIAVPSATVYVSPRADPLAKTVTVTLAEAAPVRPAVDGQHVVPAVFVDTTFQLPVRIGATGQIFEGSSARGTITIFNTSPRDKFIVPSRFLSVRDQLVFRTERAVTIPQAIGGTPGSIEVPVVACERDDTGCDCINAADTCTGNFVGDRGNIDPAYFVLPAIPSLSPALYYAESSQPFMGGVTAVTKFIRQEDLDAVRDNVALYAQRVAAERLQAVLDSMTLGSAASARTLLDTTRTTTVEVLSVEVPEGLLGVEQDEFTVMAEVRVTGVAYEEEVLRALLLDELTATVHPEKRLTKIDFPGMSVRVEGYAFADRTAKLAVRVEGVEEFEISELTTAGSRLTEKIRGRVLGTPVPEAERFIRNLPEINNAVVSSWPFWSRTMPELPENVTFEVR